MTADLNAAQVKGPMARIKAVVCEHYGIALRELHSRQRSRRIARPRQVAMYLAKRLTARSLPEIGREFDFDHTTVMHAVRRIGELVETDVQIRRDVEVLTALLESELDPVQDSLEAIAHRELRARITGLAARLLAMAKQDPMGLVVRLEDALDSLEHKPNGKGAVSGEARPYD